MNNLTEHLKLADYDPIAPEDVRVGDTVLKVQKGEITLICRQITVAEIYGHWAYDSESRELDLTVNERTILYLIDRPQPKLPTDTDSVIIVTELQGIKGEWLMMLDCDGDWFSPDRIGGFQFLGCGKGFLGQPLLAGQQDFGLFQRGLFRGDLRLVGSVCRRA